PENILPAFPRADGSLAVLEDTLPTDLSDATNAELQQNNLVIPTGLDLYNFSNINRFRYVVGETVRIPVPTPSVAKGYGAVYMLQYGPVYNTFGQDSNSNPTDSIKVKGKPLERTEQSSVISGNLGGSSAAPVLNSPSQYAIDYDRLKVAFVPRVGSSARKFYISFDYYTQADANALPTVKTILDKEITVPDIPSPAGAEEPQPVWMDLFPNGPKTDVDPNFVAFKRNSESIYRKFRLVATSGGQPQFTDDPYEYAWYSDQQGDVANVGVLLFNPRGHDYIEETTNGPEPLTALVDYAILDNHILREDRTVPTAAPYDIKLAVPFILTNGDILPDSTTYNGLFRQQNATPDLLIYNVNSGSAVGEYLNGAGQAQGDDGVRFTLDPKAGIVRLDANDVVNKHLQNASLRFFYRAQGEWGMQVQKANAIYTREPAPTDLSYRGYYIDTAGTTAKPQRMYFRVCNAGRTVLLGEYFVVDKDGKVIRLANEAYHVNDNPALFENINGVKMTWIDLTQNHPEADTDKQNWHWTDGQTGQAVSSVQGASVLSRVIWRSAERWRRVDNEKILVRAPGRERESIETNIHESDTYSRISYIGYQATQGSAHAPRRLYAAGAAGGHGNHGHSPGPYLRPGDPELQPD